MQLVNQWVEEAIRVLNLPAKELQQWDNSKASSIIQQIKSIFVMGNPRAWWMSLKKPISIFVIDDSYGISGSVDYLNEFLPSKEPFFLFIPENETGEYVVFQATLKAIKEILLECPSFEYYLLPVNLKWILCENDHHGEIIISWYNQANQ